MLKRCQDEKLLADVRKKSTLKTPAGFLQILIVPKQDDISRRQNKMIFLGLFKFVSIVSVNKDKTSDKEFRTVVVTLTKF